MEIYCLAHQFKANVSSEASWQCTLKSQLHSHTVWWQYLAMMQVQALAQRPARMQAQGLALVRALVQGHGLVPAHVQAHILEGQDIRLLTQWNIKTFEVNLLPVSTEAMLMATPLGDGVVHSALRPAEALPRLQHTITTVRFPKHLKTT